ncbi:coenzyme F430 synthase [Methanoregula sp.]|uniref:coenzyme F430 synthase n=1 Tax=Methanoregula sp. TaxID=2052170 RepID=UPI00236C7B07|nr:coenzyme F430 synthase [Methanoregula sp.]MDD1685943.1 coenzyme F430 synthase [Methanoregula sp.]
MHILVLDTIHGGKPIGDAYTSRGETVDPVDVYRGNSDVDVPTALSRTYDLIVAPVHLDPGHPLLHYSGTKVITHHEAVRHLLGNDIPQPMIEITGARGKTTTAHALAALLPGRGILHTSTGTFRFPEKEWISRSSITPGSVLAAASLARAINGWLIAEESLGVTGAGTLAIITSDVDYTFAAGKRHALAAKIASTQHSRCVLLAEGIPAEDRKGIFPIEDIASCDGTECTLTSDGKTFRFTNPLLGLPTYRNALVLAASAAVLLGIDPSPLSSFTALEGRMSARREGSVLVVDNANSGTNLLTTLEAVQYARNVSGLNDITLVIGQQEGDGKVCEGFAHDQILAAIESIHPRHLIWVGRFPEHGTPAYARLDPQKTAHARTLDEGYTLAQQKTDHGSIVLAVKTWR